MTRMWLIKPQKLCKDHLLGEHNEIHKAYGGLLNHPHGEAIIKGQVEDGNIDTSKMKVHHSVLVDEMKNRGYNHDSPFNYELTEHYGVGCIDVEQNRVDLSQRCEECSIYD